MLEARNRLWLALVAQRGIEKELFPELSKLSGRKVGELAGVASPRLLDGPIGVSELRLNEYGENFVIKPNWGTSSRGVLVLRRQSETEFVNLLDGSRMDAEGVRSRVINDVGRSGRGSTDDLIVEESMAADGVATQEWKFFTFYGHVGLIQQNDRFTGEIRTKTYSSEWQDIGDVWRQRKSTPTLAPPREPESLLEAARSISLQVPSGFLRTDLFEAPDGGVVLGELCFIPGGDRYYRGGLDRKLGQMWMDANVRLLLEGKLLIP